MRGKYWDFGLHLFDELCFLPFWCKINLPVVSSALSVLPFSYLPCAQSKSGMHHLAQLLQLAIMYHSSLRDIRTSLQISVSSAGPSIWCFKVLCNILAAPSSRSTFYDCSQPPFGVSNYQTSSCLFFKRACNHFGLARAGTLKFLNRKSKMQNTAR